MAWLIKLKEVGVGHGVDTGPGGKQTGNELYKIIITYDVRILSAHLVRKQVK